MPDDGQDDYGSDSFNESEGSRTMGPDEPFGGPVDGAFHSMFGTEAKKPPRKHRVVTPIGDGAVPDEPTGPVEVQLVGGPYDGETIKLEPGSFSVWDGIACDNNCYYELDKQSRKAVYQTAGIPPSKREQGGKITREALPDDITDNDAPEEEDPADWWKGA